MELMAKSRDNFVKVLHRRRRRHQFWDMGVCWLLVNNCEILEVFLTLTKLVVIRHLLLDSQQNGCEPLV